MDYRHGWQKENLINWRGGRVVEGARLESVYTLKAYRGFESLSLRQIKHNPQWGVMFYSVKSEWMRTLDKNDRIPLHMDMQVPWSPWMDENGLSLRQIKHNPQWGVMFYSVKSEWMRTLDK